MRILDNVRGGLSLVVVAATVALASAGTSYWTGAGAPNQDWSNPANWTPAEPTALDDAMLGPGDQAVITQMGEVCKNLNLEADASVNMLTGSLNETGDLLIGIGAGTPGSTAMFGQTGGTHQVGGMVVLGFGMDEQGQYALGGGTLQVNGGMYVGYRSAGQFQQTGGRCQVHRLLVNGLAADGTYEIDGPSAVLAADELVVGSGTAVGSGTFTFSAGQLTISDTVTVNANGVMNINTDWTCAADQFTIAGGTVNATGQNLEFSGSRMDIASYLYAGNLGFAGSLVVQQGGSVAVDEALTIGGGTYELHGGNVDAGNICNEGSLLLSGGTIGSATIVGEIDNYGLMDLAGGLCRVGFLDNKAGGYGYAQAAENGQGGGVYVSGTMELDAEEIYNGGLFQQTGGTVTVSGTFDNWGLVNLSGGLFVARVYSNYYEGGEGPTATYDGTNGAGTFISGTTSFSAVTVNNGGYFEQTGGTVEVFDGGGVFNNYGTVALSGGSTLVDTFNNTAYGGYYYAAGAGGEAPTQEGPPGLFVYAGADFSATTVNNFGWIEHAGGSLTADVLNNYAEAGEEEYVLGAGGAGGKDAGEPSLYWGRGLYVTGTADFRVDEVHNAGVVWQDGGVIASKAGGMGVFINYGGTGGYEYAASGPEPFTTTGQFYMGMSPSGTVGEDVPVFKDHLINYGEFYYYSGDFQGKYEHRTGAWGFRQFQDFTAAGGIVNWGEMANQPWMNITANGPGLHNYGRLHMHGGQLGGTQVVNEALGTLWGENHPTVTTTLINYGTVETADVMTVTGPTLNYGLISLHDGEHFRPEGGLDNYGHIEMENGGVVSGAGTVVNRPGGLITMMGAGSITAPLTNEGLLECSEGTTFLVSNLLDNVGVVILDEARVNVTTGFTNNGTVVLDSGDSILAGGPIVNNGTITGSGLVANDVTNNGVIRAQMEEEDLGQPGSGLLGFTGNCTNAAGGRIEVPADTTIVFNAGLFGNAGLIALTGGTFDNNARDLLSSGQIVGYGTIRCRTLINDGQVRTAGGDTAVFAAVDNSGWVEVIENTTTFYGDFTNNPGATVKNTGGTIRYLGTFTNNGAVISDPADNCFLDIVNGDTGYFVGGVGDRFIVAGDFLSSSTQNAQWDTAGAELIFKAGAGRQHALSVTGADLGKDPAGWVDNFAWGRLLIEPAQKLLLEDGNAVPDGGLYLGELVFGGVGSGIVLNRLHVYYLNGGDPKELFYGDANLDGMVSIADLGALADNYGREGVTWYQGDFNADGRSGIADLGALADNYGAGRPGGAAAVPEPAAAALLLVGFGALLRRRRR